MCVCVCVCVCARARTFFMQIYTRVHVQLTKCIFPDEDPIFVPHMGAERGSMFLP